MKSKFVKRISVILCVILLFSGVSVGGVAYAKAKQNGGEPSSRSDSLKASDSADESEVSKDETVYVLARSDGSVEKIIVSDWIRNALSSASLKDASDLKDIRTVDGDESYIMGGGNTRVWDAQGNDIYYQGNIDKELPVALSVSYQLNGKPVTPQELEGKSGKVSIRFDYDNKQYEMMEIGGKQEKIFVPFAMLTGMLMDNDVFRNVEVSNGKIINDGSRTVVVGIAFPGMQENLGISAEKLEIPDHVEITADAKDFSLGMTVTVAANDLFSDMDIDSTDMMKDVHASLDELTDGMNQLMNGSSSLYDGLCTLLDKSGELVRGIDRLAEGALQLKNGAYDLSSGAAQLQSGAAQLYDGLQKLDANSTALNSGAEQVFRSLLSTAQTQLEEAGLDVPAMSIGNYADVLNDVIRSLDDTAVYQQALQTVTAAVEAKRGYIEKQVTAAVNTEVESKVEDAVRAEVASKVTDGVKAQVEPKVKEAVAAALSEKVEAAVRAGVQEKVTASVLAQVRPQVEESVRAEVEKKVTEAVRETVAEKVIEAASGMKKEDFDAAVESGLVGETTQKAVELAVEQQMNSDEVVKTIEERTNEQMQSADAQKAIEENTETQMKSEKVQALIEANTDEQMKTEEVEALIAEKSEEQQKSEAYAKALADNLEEQMKSDDVQTVITEKTNEQMKSKEVKAIIAEKTKEQTDSAAVKALIAKNTESQVKKAISENMAGDEVQSKLKAASVGAKKVISLKASLDGYNAFYLGLKTYTDGVAGACAGAGELKAGADRLKDGTNQLSDGANTLYDGILTLKNGAPALVDGITQLRDGSMKLSDGLKEFDEKGIQKIVDAVDGDMEGLMERVKATIRASKDYRSFSGISGDLSGQVKFIYRTEGIGE